MTTRRRAHRGAGGRACDGTRELAERPLLNLLAAAVDASVAALRAEHPTLDDWPGLDPCCPPSLIAAEVLLARLEEMRRLTAWYLAIVELAALVELPPTDETDDLF